MKTNELTYLVLALAPFAPTPESGYRPRLTAVDPADLDAAIKAVAPGFYIPLPAELCPACGLDLRVSALKDFHPDELISADPYLRRLREAAVLIRQSLAAGAGADAIYQRLQAYPDLPVRMEKPPAASAPAAPGNSAIDDLLSMVAAPTAAAGSAAGAPAQPERWAQELEAALASILFSITSDENFRRAETAWRGLELLCRQAGDSGRVALALCPTSEAALAEALDALSEGAVAPALVVADFGFDNSTRSFDLLRRLAGFGETLLAPVITGVSPRFFGLPSWDEIDRLPFIPHLLDNAAYAKWRKLRQEGAADWLVAAVNRLPARPAFGKKNSAAVEFVEDGVPWLGAAWAPAALMAKRAAETGWPTRFDDGRRARLTGLPAIAGADGPRFSEANFSEERVRQLAEVGISAVAAEGGEARAAGAVTAAGNNANYQLALSRVIGLILSLRGQGGGAGAPEIAGGLRSALGRLWQAAGASLPEDAEIAAFEDDARGGLAVRVAVTPGPEILPSPQLIELTLNW